MMYPGYGYAPYGPYSPAGSPVPTTGHDGQLYGAQHYQYPSPYFPPMTQVTVPSKGELSKSVANGQQPLTVDTALSSAVKGSTGSATVRPSAYQNSVFNSNGSYSPFYSNGQSRNNTSSVPLSNVNGFSSKNQNVRSHSHLVVRSLI